eukprot:gene23992-31147_t
MKIFTIVERTISFVFFLSYYGRTKLFVESKEPSFVDDYHYPMVADEVRNNKFYAALAKAIVPNSSTVLDVGAGTMLLSMMAHRLGAARVVGVEGNPLMAKIAKEVLEINNLSGAVKSGKIQLFEDQFEKLKLGHKKLRKPVDILVSETFDAALIGEKFLSILVHAKSSGLLKPNATIIPHSAIIHAQLMESTFSLPLGNVTEGRDFHAGVGFGSGFNLEPMRRFRATGTYTVRYLNEANAIRRQLSPVYSMFDYDFQNYDISNAHFDYRCLVFNVTAKEGLLDSIGLWFSLHLDKEKEIVLTNSPETPSCWMQSLYRLSDDVYVKKGDFLRIQVVQFMDIYIFGQVGHGRYNEESRLIRFTAKNCSTGLDVYEVRQRAPGDFGDDDDEEEDALEVDAGGQSSKGGKSGQIDVYVGYVLPSPTDGGESYNVFPSHVGQLFKLVTRPTGNSKRFGLYYQLSDSTASWSGGKKAKARRPIPLDTYAVTCPDS